jgi:hypothetical protein
MKKKFSVKFYDITKEKGLSLIETLKDLFFMLRNNDVINEHPQSIAEAKEYVLSASDWRLLITKIDLNDDCIQSINKCFISLRGMSDDESNVSREYLNVEKAKLVASGIILLEKALKHMGRSRTIDSE